VARLLHRLGAGAVTHRLAVVLVWLAVLVGGAVGAATLGGETSNAFDIPGQESTTALERISQEFGAGGGATAQVVVRAPEGSSVTAPEVGTAVARLVDELSGLPGVASASDPFDPAAPSVDPGLTTAYSTVTFTSPVGEVAVEQQEALRETVADARAGGLVVEVGGDAVTEPPHVGGPAEAIGVVLAVVVLALTYGTLVTAGMNLLTALIGVAVGILGITITTGFTELSSTTPTLAAMLGLAVGIDYALFIINRHRQESRTARTSAPRRRPPSAPPGPPSCRRSHRRHRAGRPVRGRDPF
jgi:RND superfamily putative drug exporter